MWEWVIWAVILLAQNASFTLVSRARNSGSISFHAVASIGSNGIWFMSQIIVIDKISRALRSHDWELMAFTLVFYTLFTVIGSISMHYISMRWIEKGKRAVGAK